MILLMILSQVILLATSSQTYLLNLRVALPRILGVVTLNKIYNSIYERALATMQ